MRSVDEMLDGIVRSVSNGHISYDSHSGRYRNTQTGKYVSGSEQQRVCEQHSVDRALKIGRLFYPKL